jgi:hypothetical protein
MYDKGEKIVSLAREMLRSESLPELSANSSTSITLSFKMLCLATMLTAVGSSMVTRWAIESERPINHYEKTELDALVFYAARQKGMNEDELRRDVLGQLKLSSFDAMTEHDFVVARGYLQNKAN